MISSVIPLSAGTRKKALSASSLEADSTNSKVLTNEEIRQVEKKFFDGRCTVAVLFTKGRNGSNLFANVLAGGSSWLVFISFWQVGFEAYQAYFGSINILRIVYIITQIQILVFLFNHL